MAHFCYEYLAANELELFAEYETVKEGRVTRLEIYEPSKPESDYWIALIDVDVVEPWMKGFQAEFTFAVTWLNEIIDLSAYHCAATHKRWRDPIRIWLTALVKNIA